MKPMRLLVTLLLVLLAASALARVETYVFDTPEQEARYKSLIEELRCLVCQNQNIADSNAELALDLRQQTYEMIVAGDSDEQIYTYMVERYGDFVLYQPPVRGSTLLLWFGPFVILVIGIAILVMVIRQRNREAAKTMAETDHQRAAELLRQDDNQ